MDRRLEALQGHAEILWASFPTAFSRSPGLVFRRSTASFYHHQLPRQSTMPMVNKCNAVGEGVNVRNPELEAGGRRKGNGPSFRVSEDPGGASCFVRPDPVEAFPGMVRQAHHERFNQPVLSLLRDSLRTVPPVPY